MLVGTPQQININLSSQQILGASHRSFPFFPHLAKKWRGRLISHQFRFARLEDTFNSFRPIWLKCVGDQTGPLDSFETNFLLLRFLLNFGSHFFSGSREGNLQGFRQRTFRTRADPIVLSVQPEVHLLHRQGSSSNCGKWICHFCLCLGDKSVITLPHWSLTCRKA